MDKHHLRMGKQRGISLLEVLVALFVLAVGLLGVIALQAETIKLNQQAYGSTQAIFMANDAAEQMRVNLSAYKNTLTPEERKQPLNPSLDQIFGQAALTDWKSKVADPRYLTSGTGEVEKVGADGTDFKITITYSYDVLNNEKTDVNDDDKAEAKYILFTTL